VFRDFLSRLLGIGPAARGPGEVSDPVPEQFTLHGIPVTVLNSRPDIETAQAVNRLSDALALISVYAPDRLRRMRHDFAEIWVRRFPCRAAYYPEPRACLIELTFLVNPRHTAAEVAASLVHEAVHARLARAGIRVGQEDKAREERLCREAELEFGLAIPGGEQVVDRARESLLLADSEVAPAIDWSLAARRVAEVDIAATQRSRPEGRG
jgi:hypothetical protein